jgi:hypothetical protein
MDTLWMACDSGTSGATDRSRASPYWLADRPSFPMTKKIGAMIRARRGHLRIRKQLYPIIICHCSV